MKKRGVSPSNRFGGTASTDGFIVSPKRGENVRILCGYYQDKYQVLVSARKKNSNPIAVVAVFFLWLEVSTVSEKRENRNRNDLQ